MKKTSSSLGLPTGRREKRGRMMISFNRLLLKKQIGEGL